MKFSIAVAATITLYTEVEADSLEEALTAAQSRGVQGLCHQCSSGECGIEWSLTGEIDCDAAMMPLMDVSCDGDEVDLSKAREVWK
jgi:hypothetical protein